MTDKQTLVAWMISHGFATGHGDTVEDLLKELAWQMEEEVRQARQEEAKWWLRRSGQVSLHVRQVMRERIAALERQQEGK